MCVCVCCLSSLCSFIRFAALQNAAFRRINYVGRRSPKGISIDFLTEEILANALTNDKKNHAETTHSKVIAHTHKHTHTISMSKQQRAKHLIATYKKAIQVNDDLYLHLYISLVIGTYRDSSGSIGSHI